MLTVVKYWNFAFFLFRSLYVVMYKLWRRLRILVLILYVVHFRTFAFSHFTFYMYPPEGRYRHRQDTHRQSTREVVLIPAEYLAIVSVETDADTLYVHISPIKLFIKILYVGSTCWLILDIMDWNSVWIDTLQVNCIDRPKYGTSCVPG